MRLALGLWPDEKNAVNPSSRVRSEFETRRVRGTVVLVVRRAHLDCSATKPVTEVLARALQADVEALIVDLRRVATIDTGGIGVCVSLLAISGTVPVVLAHAAPSVIHTLRNSRLAPLFSFKNR
jgi:anti-anti-sigma regulatory factor